MQPIIDENLYKMGDEAFRQERGVHDCQESLDALAGLTSDQYDSFWEGYWDAHREVKEQGRTPKA